MSEHEIIRNIISKYSYVNDDVYVDENKNMYKIDGFQLGYTFNFMDFYDIGWKSVVASISDILSRGGIPTFVLSSIGIRKEDVQKIEDIIKGIKDASDYYNASYIGGDLNSSKNGWIDVTVIGKAICYKKAENVKEGDRLIISNPIGYTSLVFLSYLNNWKISISNIEKNKIRHPIVNKRLSELFATYCDSIHYSTDISDGLVISLYNVIERSKKGIKMYSFPFPPYILGKIRKYELKEEDLLKYSGEEYETILVVDRTQAESILDFMNYLGFSPQIIGEIISNPTLEYNNQFIKKTGWDNFTGWF
ncbi:thiamine-phosphate kinase [Sulfurisphaera javensis]|uniref:Thiamine-phosphate kinase n=1 Tax=Sulfurisphaera javensis TaxID=2049879 RepID=A0AAT9GR44_9CREN